jgi:hypothetical protein
MCSSKKNRNRLLIGNAVSWLIISIALIITQYNDHFSISVLVFIYCFILPSILFAPFICITLWTYHRDKDKEIYFEYERIIVTNKEKKLIIYKEDIREIKKYSRLFYSDLTIDLKTNVKLKISNAHEDYKETLKKLKSWDIPVLNT